MLQTLKFYIKNWKTKKKQSLVGLTPGVNPTKLQFLHFFIFAFKLGHFKVQTIFSYAANTQVEQQKKQ